MFDTYSKEAETLLSRAVRCWRLLRGGAAGCGTSRVFARQVKLDPKNADAWNALGLNYWKKQDLVAAKACFEGGATQVLLCVCVLSSPLGARILHRCDLVFFAEPES